MRRKTIKRLHEIGMNGCSCIFIQNNLCSFKITIAICRLARRKGLQTLFASGASLSYIKEDSLKNLEHPVKLRVERRIDIIFEAHFIEIKHRVTLDFYYTMCYFQMNF